MSTPSLTPREKRQEKQDGRRRQIVSACRKLFFETSYDAVSVRDLEQATGLTRGAIYYYFAGKEDIYCAVVIEGLQRVREVLMEAAEPLAGKPREQLLALCIAMADHHAAERPIFDNLLRFHFGMRPTVKLTPQLLDAANDEIRAIVDFVREIIEAGNACGDFDCDDPEFAVMSLWGFMVTTVQMTDDNERMKAVGRPRDKLLRDMQALTLRIVGARG